MVLVIALANFSPPHCSPPDVATLANQNVAVPKRKPLPVFRGDVHLIYLRQIEPPPEDIGSAKEWLSKLAGLLPIGERLALLERERVVNLRDFPIDGKPANLGLSETVLQTRTSGLIPNLAKMDFSSLSTVFASSSISASSPSISGISR